MRRKLFSTGGYTILESLVALVIVVIMITAAASAAVASATVYKQSTALSEAGVLCSTLSESISDELRFAADITVAPGGDNHLNTFTSVNYGPGSSFSNEEGRIGILTGGTNRSLISDLTYTGLEAAAQMTYDSGVFYVILVVTAPDSGNAECARAEFSIAPLNP